MSKLEKQRQPKCLKAPEKVTVQKEKRFNKGHCFFPPPRKSVNVKSKEQFLSTQLSWLRQRKLVPCLQVVFQAIVVSHHHALDSPVAPGAFLLFSWREIQPDDAKRMVLDFVNVFEHLFLFLILYFVHNNRQNSRIVFAYGAVTAAVSEVVMVRRSGILKAVPF